MPGLEAAKAYMALIVSLAGAVATALTGVYGADSHTGKVVTVVLAVVTALSTALATYRTQNAVQPPPPLD